MRIEKNLATADMLVRLTFSAVVVILFLLNVLNGPLAAALLVLSGIFLITVIVGKRSRHVIK
ncbi:MAG: hypothetical protein ABIR06_21520 [Cyclobacteriaceae bacterium]